MIERIGPFEWLCIYGSNQQKVVGTRYSAEQTLRTMKAAWKQDLKLLPWYLRWAGTLNMKMIDLIYM